MIFLLYFLLIFFLIIDKIKQRSFFAPSTFFNIVFISIISLYQLKISYLQQDLSYRTLLIFISSILSFNIGCLLIDNFSFKELKKIKSSNDKTLNKDIIHYIFILLFIVECIYSKGFPLLNLVLTGNSNYLHL